MAKATHIKTNVAQRARQIYDERIRAQVEPDHIGEFVAVDVKSGRWEMDSAALTAIKRLNAENPETVFLLRAGHRTAFTLGGRIQVKQP